jgi:hypothetical protein
LPTAASPNRSQAEWNNWNSFSTTSYNKSLCAEGCVLAVPVVPPAEAACFWGRDSVMYGKSLEVRHFQVSMDPVEPELALFPGRSNRWG